MVMVIQEGGSLAGDGSPKKSPELCHRRWRFFLQFSQNMCPFLNKFKP